MHSIQLVVYLIAMFKVRREQSLEQVHWRGASVPFENIQYEVPYLLAGLECWRYKDLTTPLEGVNWRFTMLATQSESGKSQAELDARVEDWLESRGPFEAPASPTNAGILEGGIRLILCDRQNMLPAITMSADAFKSIEAKFRLHPSTIPALFAHGGAFSSFSERDPLSGATKKLDIMVKYIQKWQIGNLLLSMTHDVQSGWTMGFICGQAIVGKQRNDPEYGAQLPQIRSAILSEPRIWNDPLLLPTVLFQNHAKRVEAFISETDGQLTEVEKKLAVTNAGAAWLRENSEDWPRDIDTKDCTIKLHTASTEIISMKSTSSWLRRYGVFLLELNEQLRADDAFSSYRNSLLEIRDIIRHVISWVDGFVSYFGAFYERANLQVNVLFNIVAQQANILSQQESRLNTSIAKSTKQDSISMTIFTFITALYLPASFVAALLGTSMFDWQQEASGPASQTFVTPKFWLYWAIAIPLTVITMVFWGLWRWYDTQGFKRQLANAGPGKPLNTQEEPKTWFGQHILKREISAIRRYRASPRKQGDGQA